MSSRASGDPSIALICVIEEHLEMGQRIPDGRGTLTMVARRWAYCTAGLRNAKHEWKETGGLAFDSIRHSELTRFLHGT